MKVGKFLSNYLKVSDVKAPLDVTISSVEEEIFAEGKPEEEHKLAVYFREVEQGCVLSKVGIRQLVALTGSEETGAWVGKRVTLFADPTVQFHGKPVGGLRFREAK